MLCVVGGIWLVHMVQLLVPFCFTHIVWLVAGQHKRGRVFMCERVTGRRNKDSGGSIVESHQGSGGFRRIRRLNQLGIGSNFSHGFPVKSSTYPTVGLLSRGVDSKYSKPVGQSHFSVMKILHANAGALTNFEVLDFLRSRGAANDPTRVIVSVAPSEFKVFDYLNQSAVCNQTRESIEDFAEKCKQYDLAKAEILNIINVRPASAVEIDPIIEHCETRLGDSVDGLVDLVAEVLPPPPTEDAPDAEPPGVEAPDVPGQQETKTG